MAQNDNGRRSAIDGRTTRHPGYAVSLRIRKQIEEALGWAKTVAGLRKARHRGLTLAPVNKVHHVRTIARVAEMLGEDEEWLWDVADEMDQEDGLIWVYGQGDDGVMAFTDFGIENLVDLVEMH